MTTETKETKKPSEFKLALVGLVEEYKVTAWDFLEERLEGNSEDSVRAFQLHEFVRNNKNEIACDIKRLLNKNLKVYVRDIKFWEGK